MQTLSSDLRSNGFNLSKLKVAVVHDWLTVIAGAEKVLLEILKICPHADLFSVMDHRGDFDLIKKASKTTFIQKLPFSKTKYPYYLPLMPFAIEQLNLSSYDLILSSSHAVAKGVIVSPDQTHICYCHSPMRYIWDMQSYYSPSLLTRYFFHRLRQWDALSAKRVDYFVANSHFVAKRIEKAYRRQSSVIYPPVNTDFFSFQGKKQEFYLTASRLVPYKNIELIIQAFALMKEKTLYVIGEGPLKRKMEKTAPPNVKLLGYQSNEELKRYLQQAKGFLFAAKEDFGILPLEAQSCGTPVIALAKGGACESILGRPHNKATGCFFYEETPDAIVEAVKEFEEQENIQPEHCRENALRFSSENFRAHFLTFIQNQLVKI